MMISFSVTELGRRKNMPRGNAGENRGVAGLGNEGHGNNRGQGWL